MAKVLERSLYQTDYYAWTKDQAAKLRALAAARVNSPLDLENLAEEIESSGRSDWRAARRQVQRVIEHLLKLEFSPARELRSESMDRIGQARDELVDLLTPVLRREVEEDIVTAFERGKREAAKGLRRHGEREAAQALPTTCPYSLDQIVSHDWYPKNRHGILDNFDGET
jgi:Domain of unknown function DUF29